MPENRQQQTPANSGANPGSPIAPSSQPATATSQLPPQIPDHELLRRIGGGSYGEVWLARNIVGTMRAVKIVQRQTFERDEHFEREFKGIQKFEPISRSHEGLVDILQIGRNDTDGYFYYVMELADAVGVESETVGKWESEKGVYGVKSEWRLVKAAMMWEICDNGDRRHYSCSSGFDGRFPGSGCDAS